MWQGLNFSPGIQTPPNSRLLLAAHLHHHAYVSARIYSNARTSKMVFKVAICVCCRIRMLCTNPWGCPWESKFLMPLWCLSLPIRQRRTWLLKYFQHCFHILHLSQNRIHSRFSRSQLLFNFDHWIYFHNKLIWRYKCCTYFLQT